MSIKLICDHSPGLVHLFETQQISLDGVEFNPFTSPEKIEALRADYPGLPFIFHASNVGRVPFSLRKWNAITGHAGNQPGSPFTSR